MLNKYYEIFMNVLAKICWCHKHPYCCPGGWSSRHRFSTHTLNCTCTVNWSLHFYHLPKIVVENLFFKGRKGKMFSNQSIWLCKFTSIVWLEMCKLGYKSFFFAKVSNWDRLLLKFVPAAAGCFCDKKGTIYMYGSNHFYFVHSYNLLVFYNESE